MKKILFIIVIVLAAACEREVGLASIEVPSTIDAHVGDKTQLQVTYSPAEAIAPNMYLYNTNNKSVATVDANGVIVCRQEGTCVISIATADKRFSTKCTVNVKNQR